MGGRRRLARKLRWRRHCRTRTHCASCRRRGTGRVAQRSHRAGCSIRHCAGESVPACLCVHSRDTHSEREEPRLGSVPVRKLSERSLRKGWVRGVTREKAGLTHRVRSVVGRYPTRLSSRPFRKLPRRLLCGRPSAGVFGTNAGLGVTYRLVSELKLLRSGSVPTRELKGRDLFARSSVRRGGSQGPQSYAHALHGPAAVARHACEGAVRDRSRLRLPALTPSHPFGGQVERPQRCALREAPRRSRCGSERAVEDRPNTVRSDAQEQQEELRGAAARSHLRVRWHVTFTLLLTSHS